MEMLVDVLSRLPGETLLKALHKKLYENLGENDKRITGHELLRRLEDIMSGCPEYRRLVDCRPTDLLSFHISLIEETARRDGRLLNADEQIKISIFKEMLKNEIEMESLKTVLSDVAL